jgi:diadenosine tetraphosphate (Ap4A) HIT family hydrolase
MTIPFERNRLVLHESANWRAVLNKNQAHLGRMIVYLRTREIDDPLELTRNERDELWDEVFPALARALDVAFAPDRINYAHLANQVHHVHWHVVPRYETSPDREFAGFSFVDPKPGRPYSRAKKRRPPNDVLRAICAEIRRGL